MSNQSFRDDWQARFGRPEPKVVCVGLNYSDHTGESQMEAPKAPLLFGKFANTLCGDDDAIVLPDGVGHVDAEAELALVIGRTASSVSKDDAMEFVEGWTCANDVSARGYQFGDGQWFRGKSLDTFCPVGPRVVPRDDVDWADLRIQQRLNGETLQDSRTSRLIFDVLTLVSYVSAALTLERGDLILTGTPAGVGFFRDPKVALAPGDVVEVEIEGIGVLRNDVRAA
jgi:2-keto-4-pentenoate hydratase/2-oxohepta-3-ene-1,7-dioic acid hydratase in catechol pathway